MRHPFGSLYHYMIHMAVDDQLMIQSFGVERTRAAFDGVASKAELLEVARRKLGYLNARRLEGPHLEIGERLRTAPDPGERTVAAEGTLSSRLPLGAAHKCIEENRP